MTRAAAVRVEQLDAAAMAAWQPELARFERAFTYPLGNDRFHIDHGADYFAFFRALGEPSVYVALVDGAHTAPQLAGVLVAVRRRLPRAVWYLCDLKVAPGAAGRFVARRLLHAWHATAGAHGEPAFAVSMDAADGDNRLRRLALGCAEARVCAGPRLGVWSLDFAACRRVLPLLARELRPRGWYDPRGRKDIVLASTGRPLPLLHLQHGPCARDEVVAAPRPGCTHMLCLPLEDPLAIELAAAGAPAGATASVLHVGLAAFAWRHLLTSDI